MKISVYDMDGILRKLDEIIQSSNSIYALTCEIIGKEAKASIQSLFTDLATFPIYKNKKIWLKYDSPILAMLPKEKSFFAAFLPQMLKTCPCLIFSSPKSSDEVKRLFKRRLIITAKNSNGDLYRYYGVKLTKPFINAVSYKRAAEFFGLVEDLIWPFSDMRGNLQWLSCSFPPQHNGIRQPARWRPTHEEWQRFEENFAEDILLTEMCRDLIQLDVHQLKGLPDAEIRQKVRDAIRKAGTYGLFSKQDIRFFCEMELGFYPGIFNHPKVAALLKDARHPDRKTQEIVDQGARIWPELMRFSDKYRETADALPSLKRKRARAVFLHTEEIREGPDGFYLQAPYDYRHKWPEPRTEPIGHAGFSVALYFRGGHLPEMQEAVCEFIREYADILGEKARCCVTPPGRLVIREKRKLPLMDEKHVERRQKRGEWIASFMLCSNATSDEYKHKPPECMLDTALKLAHRKPFYSVKNNPDLPSDIHLDRQISYLSASFEPSMFGKSEPHKSFAELVFRWIQRLQPVSGTAGWGITRGSEWMTASGEAPLIAPYLLRFPGLGWIPDPSFPFFMDLFATHITDINWLTIINKELAERVGGIGKLRLLDNDVSIAEYPGGYVIQAGERPEYGDMEKGNNLPLYGKVQNLLHSLYLPPRYLNYVTWAAIPPNAGPDYIRPTFWGDCAEDTIYLYDFYEHWLHRFDANWRSDNA